MAESEVVNALFNLLNELIDGSAPGAAWILNPEDPGLMGSLGRLSAEKASAVPSSGGASIAAHVDHLRYGLELMNRWSRGEKPFADADYSASWRRGEVSEPEWASRREALRREAYAWREALGHPRDLTDLELTGVLASVAHLAYHLGAIRQIDRSTRGPSARD
ncbi:MAG: DinB family protein [Bryobacteraceae bacterium]